MPGLVGTLLGRMEAALGPGGSSEDVRSFAYAFGALLGALVLFATVVFQLIRLWVNERLAHTTEQGHVTDRINKAVEQLGAERTVKRRVRAIRWKDGDGERARTFPAGDPLPMAPASPAAGTSRKPCSRT